MMDDALEHNGKTLLSAARLETCCNLYHRNSPATLWIPVISMPRIIPHTSMANSVLYFQVNCSSQTEDDRICGEWWLLPHALYVATMLRVTQISRKADPAALNLWPHCQSFLATPPPTPTLTIYLNLEQTLKTAPREIKILHFFLYWNNGTPKTRHMHLVNTIYTPLSAY